jgi:DNA replication protein DnaC
MENSISPISSLSHVSDHRTFDKFSARRNENLPTDEQKSLDNAFTAAQQFSERPDGWLVLMGGYGTGKTHLAAASAITGQPWVTIRSSLSYPTCSITCAHTFSPSSTVSYDKRLLAGAHMRSC